MTKAIPGLNYEQLLEMISDLQWIPEKRCIRLVLEGYRDGLPSNPVFGGLNRFCGVIEGNPQQDPLTGHTVQILLSKLAMHSELIQRIDGDNVVTEVNRLVKTIGVNLVLIGFSNGYSTALALVLRTRFPLEWNKFCDFAERQSWKIDMNQVGSRSQSESGTGYGRDQVQGPVVVNDAHVQSAAPGSNTVVSTGSNRMSELEEEDEDDLISGPVAGTTTNSAGRTHEWRFRKLKPRR